MKKLILLGLILILSSYLVAGVCTISLNKENYNKGETAVVSMSCGAVAEKNKAYTVNWTNITNELEVDTGTTPNSVDEVFLESYTIPSDYASLQLNISLVVDGVEKGYDNASVAAAGTNDLLFTSCSVAGNWLGLTSSAKCIVTDENSKKISGGNCIVSVWNNIATQMLEKEVTQIYNGELKARWELEYENFDEGIDYKTKLICYCGANSSVNECINEDGDSVTNSVGNTIVAFTTNTWITIREDPMPITYANGTDYPNAVVFAGFGENIFFRANLTNNRGEDVELEILTFLINNETGAIHQEPNARARTIEFQGGNVSAIGVHEITKDAQTGVYYIKKFFDVIFNNIVVAQGVVNTESFNITGTDDSFKLNTVVTDKTNYYTGEFIHVCANVSSLFDKRIEFNVLYNVRCSESGLDSDTERTLIGEHREFRAINADSTQEQCAEIFVDYKDHLKYKTTQCYASITLESDYIDSFDKKLLKISSFFNVTDFGYYPEYEPNPTYPLVRLFSDWRRFDNKIDNVNRSYVRTKVNISELREEWLDPDDNIRDDDWDIYVMCNDNMPSSQEHFNFTVLNSSGGVIDNEVEAKELQWVNGNGITRSKCAIGIENVNFSDSNDDWFEVRIWYEDFNERSTKALEGINSSAGTFDFGISVSDTSGTTTTVTGTGRTGDGRTLNRDLNVKCQVDGYPESYIEFKTYATDTFAFTKEIKVPSRQSTYTVTCTAIDRFFGEDAVRASGNFRKIFVLQGGAGGQVSKIEGDSLMDRLKKEFLETTRSEWLFILGIVVVGIFLLYGDKFEGEEFEI